MSETKTKVTLMGTVLAKPNVEFIYEGEVAECDTCKVKKACHNLQKGRKYRIVTVRSTHHDCAVHLNGATAVEVMEAPITALINADMAIINSKIKPELSCNKSDCRSFPLSGRMGLRMARSISSSMCWEMLPTSATRAGH